MVHLNSILIGFTCY